MSGNDTILAGAASSFADFLAGGGWMAEPKEPHSPYAVKVGVGDSEGPSGHLVIYYSAKKGLSLVTQEVKRAEHRVPLQQAWDRFRADGTEIDVSSDTSSARSPAEADAPPATDGVQATLYVDGSYVDGRASYGYVAVHDGASVAEGSGDDVPPGWLQHHNVAGEMWAVVKALEYCAGQGWRAVTIAHDYEGLEAWATGRWRAKKPATRAYQQAVRGSEIDVQWFKVKAHTGVVWNERADALAAEALAFPTGDALGAGAEPAAPEDFLRNGFAQLAVRAADLRLSETLQRGYQLNFSVSQGGQKLGSGSLYTDAKGGLKLVLHPNLPTATADHLRALWEKRHVARTVAEGAADPLRRTRHVMGILSDYRQDRVSMRPLRDALVNDLEAVFDTMVLRPAQESALRRLSDAVASAPTPDFGAIVADVERAASLLRKVTQ